MAVRTWCPLCRPDITAEERQSRMELRCYRHQGTPTAQQMANTAREIFAPKPAPQSTGETHYSDQAIQPIEYIEANGLPFHEGNVVRYISRWRAKNGVEDLRKCRWYVDRLIELAEAEEDAHPPRGVTVGDPVPFVPVDYPVFGSSYWKDAAPPARDKAEAAKRYPTLGLHTQATDEVSGGRFVAPHVHQCGLPSPDEWALDDNPVLTGWRCNECHQTWEWSAPRQQWELLKHVIPEVGPSEAPPWLHST